MSYCNTYLYFDKDNHIWKFVISENGELRYSIMYGEDKWTKEMTIDNEVLDFTVNIDRQDNVYQDKTYVIYSTKHGELKYCNWENNQWLDKIIYKLENASYEMSEIDAHFINGNIHMFFVVKSCNSKNLGTLMHFCWNREKSFFNKITNITLMEDVDRHYQIEAYEDGRLYITFISNEANETAVKFAEYKEDKWNNLRRLYGINGDKVSFSTILHNDNINILNFSKEASMYILEHVYIEADGNMVGNKIYETPIDIENYMLLEKDKVLYALWCQNERILYSYFKDKWSTPVEYSADMGGRLNAYRFIASSSKFKSLRAKMMLGSLPPEITLITPSDNSRSLLLSLEGVKQEGMLASIEKAPDVIKISDIKNTAAISEIKDNYEKKIVAQQLQLQQKQKIIEDMERNLTKLISDKRLLDEKFKIITDIHQTNLKEMDAFKSKEEHWNKEISDLKHKLQNALQQRESLEKLLEEAGNENEMLKKQLLFEKNRGIIDIIFNKRSSG